MKHTSSRSTVTPRNSLFSALARRIAGPLAGAVLFVSAPPAWAVTGPSAGASTAQLPATAASSAVTPAAIPAQQGPESQSVLVLAAAGAVEARSADSDVWRQLRPGDILRVSDTIRTGEDGSAAIEFDGKIRVQVLASTELTVEEAQRGREQTRQTLLRLDIGKIKASVDKLGEGSSFQIKTPTAVSAVRGTTLYLSVVRFAQGLAGIITDLYVEEGKVDFSAIGDEVNALFVEAFHASSIGGDGEKTEPRELTPEEREQIISAFEKAFASLGGNPQTGVETGALPGGPGAAGLPGAGPGAGGNDILERLIQDLIELRDENAGVDDEDTGDPLDTLDELLLISLKLTAQLLAEGVDLSGGFDFDQVSAGFDLGIVSDERTDILDEALASNDPADVVEAIAALQDIRDAEKQDLRNTLDSILDNQEFLNEDAQQEKEFDAQTGKVFTDVHGNRVRTDQYIYHEPGTDLVRLVSLTLRTGEYQNGVTSLEFGTRFNEALPEGTLLRDLPWNDYMNVVTSDEFDPRYVYGQGGHYYDQYIVHENSSAEDDLGIYPVDLYAEFKNPSGDKIRFSEHYTEPYLGTFYTGDTETEEASTQEFWVQGRVYESTLIQAAGWESPIEYGSRGWPGWDGNGTDISFIDGRDGSQSGDLSAFPEIINELDGPGAGDLFDGIGNNSDGNPDNDLHPSYFRDVIGTYDGNYQLTGYFIPIDNLGRIIDAPGFRVQGVRDLVNPNSLVAGGEYNLEAILLFGNQGEGGFEELFRIDAIITPEIFTPYGLNGSNTLFPDNFVADDDDQGKNYCESFCGDEG